MNKRFARRSKDFFLEITVYSSFLQDQINFYWQQRKRKLKKESSIQISWDKFKASFCRAFRDSQAFVNSYWTKIRWDSQYQLEEVLGRRLKTFTGCIKWIRPYRYPQWNNPDTLFLRGATSVYSSPVRPSKTRLRYVGISGRKSR